jgi:hypothetical protein
VENGNISLLRTFFVHRSSCAKRLHCIFSAENHNSNETILHFFSLDENRAYTVVRYQFGMPELAVLGTWIARESRNQKNQCQRTSTGVRVSAQSWLQPTSRSRFRATVFHPMTIWIPKNKIGHGE